MNAELGQYEKAAEITRQAQLLRPDYHGFYGNLATYALALQQFNEARQIIHQAQTTNVDDFPMRTVMCALAFIGSDSAGMAEQQQWFAGKAEYENFGLALASDTEGYAGQAAKARELLKRAVDSAVRTDNKEVGAIYLAIAAQREAAYGNPVEARLGAAEAVNLAPESPGAAVESALAFAIAGDTGRAESLGPRPGKALSVRHPDAVALAACDSGAIGSGPEPSGSGADVFASCFRHRVRDDSVRQQCFLPLSDIRAW